MKTNKFKNNVNVIDLVDQFVVRLNRQFESENKNRIIEIVIKKSTIPLNTSNIVVNKEKGGAINSKKEGRTLYVYLHNTESRERIVLYQNAFYPSNPSNLITGDYKRGLYVEFLYSCFGIFGLNMEDTIIANRLKKLEEGLTSTNTK